MHLFATPRYLPPLAWKKVSICAGARPPSLWPVAKVAVASGWFTTVDCTTRGPPRTTVAAVGGTVAVAVNTAAMRWSPGGVYGGGRQAVVVAVGVAVAVA